VYGISSGVLAGWASVLDVNVKHFGIGKGEAGWIGFYSIIAGSVGALVFSRINDCLPRHTKSILLILMFGAAAAFTWFLFMCLKIFPLSRVTLYLSATAGGLFVNGAVPLFYEVAAETAYPIPEDVSLGMLTLMNNMFCLVFLLLPMFSELKETMKDWMNPTMAGSCFICIPLLIFFKTRYQRLSVDLNGL
jgi:FLVCR family MFS transporter